MSKSLAVLFAAGFACAGAFTPAQAQQRHGGSHGGHAYHGGGRGHYAGGYHRHYGYGRSYGGGYYGRPYYGGGYSAGPPCIPVLGIVSGNFCNY